MKAAHVTGRQCKTKAAGFTLIEIAISMAIIALIGLVITKFWINTSEAFTLDTNKVTAKQQSERVLEIMTERIARATVGTIVLSNGNATIDFVDGSDLSNVQYTLNPLAPTAPVWGRVIQTVNGTQSTIAGYVQTLQFAASGTGLVTIDVTVVTGTGRTQATLSVQSSVSARN